MLKNLAAWLFVPGKAKVPPFVWLALLIAVGYLLRAPSSPVPGPAEALTERIVVLTPTPGPTPIVAAPVETPTPVGSGGTVAFSMRHNGNSDIYLLSQANGELLRLTYDPDEDRDPAWSPDGRYIAFASRRSRGWDLYTMDMATGTILRITRTPDFEGAPAWSPDARWLAYEGYVDGNLDIYIQNLESGESQRVTTGRCTRLLTRMVAKRALRGLRLLPQAKQGSLHPLTGRWHRHQPNQHAGPG